MLESITIENTNNIINGSSVNLLNKLRNNKRKRLNKRKYNQINNTNIQYQTKESYDC